MIDGCRWLLLLGALAACDDGASTTESAMPAEATPSAIFAFIDDHGFEGPGWRAETDAPRPETTAVSPHDRVQVFQNERLITSRTPEGAYAADSMAVKVIYGEGDEAVGHAMMWLEPDARRFTYFCYGPRDRCGLDEQETPRDEPIFGRGIDVVCGHCHGGVVFTEIAP